MVPLLLLLLFSCFLNESSLVQTDCTGKAVAGDPGWLWKTLLAGDHLNIAKGIYRRVSERYSEYDKCIQQPV